MNSNNVSALNSYSELAAYTTRAHLRILLDYVIYAQGLGLRPPGTELNIADIAHTIDTYELDTTKELYIMGKIKDWVYLLSEEAPAAKRFQNWARRRKLQALITE